uniref:Uncharacterized protein n=1 Tax=viral metagenome TaxID=1070528 RepID=A0A6C0BP58_9ZZZZ
MADESQRCPVQRHIDYFRNQDGNLTMDSISLTFSATLE